ncbi:MAG: cupin domain-containing protein [bacterium]
MSHPIGERIKTLRLSSQLTQEELAARSNLTKGFISQVERDLTSISLENLALMLSALDTSLAEFFAEEEEKPVVFRRSDRRSMEWGGSQNLEVLVPGGTNRTMDPTVVHLAAGEAFGCERPHEGEELGYVLTGTVRLRVSKKSWLLKAGECFYYRANRMHGFQNEGTNEAQVLWIASPPRL